MSWCEKLWSVQFELGKFGLKAHEKDCQNLREFTCLVSQSESQSCDHYCHQRKGAWEKDTRNQGNNSGFFSFLKRLERKCRRTLDPWEQLITSSTTLLSIVTAKFEQTLQVFFTTMIKYWHSHWLFQAVVYFFNLLIPLLQPQSWHGLAHLLHSCCFGSLKCPIQWLKFLLQNPNQILLHLGKRIFCCSLFLLL